MPAAQPPRKCTPPGTCAPVVNGAPFRWLCGDFGEFGRKRGFEAARAGDKPVEKESSGHGAVLFWESKGDIVRGEGAAEWVR